MDSTDENYPMAWKLIYDKYNNERALVNKQLKLLTTQQAITGDPAKGLQKLHDTTKECTLALKSLRSMRCHIFIFNLPKGR